MGYCDRRTKLIGITEINKAGFSQMES